MKILWITDTELNTTSAQSLVATELNAPTHALILPRYADWPAWRDAGRFEPIIKLAHAKGVQRIAVCDFIQHQTMSLKTLAAIAPFVQTYLFLFDIPAFLPEEVPSDEKWLGASRLNILTRHGHATLVRQYQLVSAPHHTWEHDPHHGLLLVSPRS